MSVTGPQTATGHGTLLGLGAIGLWAILAALTALAGPIPPFQLSAMTFTVGTLVGLAWAAVTRQSLATLRRVPLAQWLLGVYGLLVFHACYFFALQQAPPLEASLVIYLWPLLIVLLSGLLPARFGGKPFAWWHIAGALLGFAGTALIITGGGTSHGLQGSVRGYLLALAAAFIWSSYSVASRFFAKVPSIAVIGSCAATAVGAFGLHLATETWTWPASISAWLAILMLGLGPVGLAFYLWDEGMKHGNMRLLGVASYATPLLSTLVMAGLGLGRATTALWLAAALIAFGALLASREAR